MSTIKFKKLHPRAILPKRATPYDAGLDLTACSLKYDDINSIYDFGFGLAVEIPEGYVGLIFPRSSIYKTNMELSNAVGVIDCKYRGELRAKFRMINGVYNKSYEVGDRIAQLVLVRCETAEAVETEELDMLDDRGGGFGSSGTKDNN